MRTMATGTYTLAAIQIQVFAAFSPVP